MIFREVATQQERIKLLQDEISAAHNERNDRRLFILTAVTVVALPDRPPKAHSMAAAGIGVDTPRLLSWRQCGLQPVSLEGAIRRAESLLPFVHGTISWIWTVLFGLRWGLAAAILRREGRQDNRSAFGEGVQITV